MNEKPLCRIERVYLPDRVLGSWYINDELVCKTLERPWLNNKRAVSCVAEGIYDVIKQPPKPDRPYPYLRLPKVPGRSGILVHRGRRPAHSKGCILVGMSLVDVGNDTWELTDSTTALNKLLMRLPEKFKLEIKKKEG